VTGAGKTTMAERSSTATGLPWHSVDDLTWEPGWVEVPQDVQRQRIAEICDRDEWILDIAYGR
jgi:adenylate kinase family enzyme